jgi:hypothetical protein
MVVRGGSFRKRGKRPGGDGEESTRTRRPETKDKRHQNWQDYLEDAEEEFLEEASDAENEGEEEDESKTD